MSWMSEVAILIEEAAQGGVTLELDDFGRKGNTLTIRGIPVDVWFQKEFEITPVLFRVSHKDQNDVYALFPTLEWCPGMVTAYSHLGEHQSANYSDCMVTSRRAAPHEYAALARELKLRGYHLRIRTTGDGITS